MTQQGGLLLVPAISLLLWTTQILLHNFLCTAIQSPFKLAANQSPLGQDVKTGYKSNISPSARLIHRFTQRSEGAPQHIVIHLMEDMSIFGLKHSMKDILQSAVFLLVVVKINSRPALARCRNSQSSSGSQLIATAEIAVVKYKSSAIRTYFPSSFHHPWREDVLKVSFLRLPVLIKPLALKPGPFQETEAKWVYSQSPNSYLLFNMPRYS